MLKGIDISHFEPNINWARVKAAGIDFAFTKASEGIHYADDQLGANWAGIRANGIVRGAYHFFNKATDPVAQAQHFYAVMNNIQPGALQSGDFFPVLDFESEGEDAQGNAIPATRRDVLNAVTCLHAIQGLFGVNPMLYSNSSFLEDAGFPLGSEAIPLWLANYNPAPIAVPAPWQKYDIWQYSNTGNVAGVNSETVDMNQFDGTLDDLKRLLVQ